MECVVCEVRLAAGRCPVCGRPLCEMCGTLCEACGRPSCGGHAQLTTSGQALCKKCAEKNRVPRPEPPPAKREPAPASTSFAALHETLPEVERDYPETADRGPRQKEISAKALTGSSPKPTPMWVSSLFTGGMSWVLLIPLVPFTSRSNIFHAAQPWMSYCIVFLGLGTMLWAGAGTLGQGPRKERWLCLMGAAIGLAAALVAFLVRTPAATG